MHTNFKLQLDKQSALTGANIDSLTQKFYALKERLAGGIPGIPSIPGIPGSLQSQFPPKSTLVEKLATHKVRSVG